MYYGKLLPHLPSTLAPLYSLLHQGTEWRWGQKEQGHFRSQKTYCSLPMYLYTLIPSYQLSCWSGISSQDARWYRKPIGCASQTLSAVKRQYSQIEKEGL